MADPKYTPGQELKYWGHAKGNALYGKTVKVLYANTCSCPHQMYSVTYTLDNGTTSTLDKVLEDNLRPLD